MVLLEKHARESGFRLPPRACPGSRSSHTPAAAHPVRCRVLGPGQVCLLMGQLSKWVHLSGLYSGRKHQRHTGQDLTSAFIGPVVPRIKNLGGHRSCPWMARTSGARNGERNTCLLTQWLSQKHGCSTVGCARGAAPCSGGPHWPLESPTWKSGQSERKTSPQSPWQRSQLEEWQRR